MIELDGSYGEGGGAILRVALGLSTITQQPFRIANIRSGRPQPGLKHEHLHCVRLLQAICGAKVEDAHLGSEQLLFIPGEPRSCKIERNLETAASTTLVAHALLLAILFSGKRLTINLVGGTDVKWSIPADILSNVFLPHIRTLGRISVKTLRRGYYPKGSGALELKIAGNGPGSPVQPLMFTDRGELMAIKGSSHASLSLEGKRVAERQQSAAQTHIKHGAPFDIQPSYSDTASVGSCLSLWAKYEHATLSGSALGERDVSAETVGQTAAAKLATAMDSGACVDAWTADQLLPFMAVCGGEMIVEEVTKHLHSNIYVIEKFLPTALISVKGNRVTCTTN